MTEFKTNFSSSSRFFCIRLVWNQYAPMYMDCVVQLYTIFYMHYLQVKSYCSLSTPTQGSQFECKMCTLIKQRNTNTPYYTTFCLISCMLCSKYFLSNQTVFLSLDTFIMNVLREDFLKKGHCP